MSTKLPSREKLKPNTEWAKLPLFDRKGWRRVRFGDVVENSNESERDPESAGIERFIGLEHLEPGSLHVRSWGNVVDGTTFTRRCKPGQVLFGKRRAYQRKVAVAEFDAVVSGDIYVLAPKNDKLLPELLPFICLSERFFQHAVGTSAGSLSPRTNWSSLASFEFDLPPLDQQRRIAEILWAVDEVDQSLLETSDNIVRLHEAKVRESFLVNGPGKAEVFLQDICDVQCGYAFKSTDYKHDGIPLVRISNVADPYVDLSDSVVYLDARFMTERSEFILSKGDVLVALSGATTGKTGIYNSDQPALLNQRVGRLRYRADSPVSRALFNQAFFLFRERILRDAYGAAQPNISPKDFRKYSIFVPTNTTGSALEEELEKLVKVREATAALSQETSRLRAIILATIFD
jgi:type I restriction enzyme S subunit